MPIKIPGVIAILVATFAGMVDLVALSVWTPALENGYGLAATPAEATPIAGLLVTLYLAAGVVASLIIAPFAPRLNGRWGATIGFGLAALATYLITIDSPFPVLVLFHLLAGLGAGTGLTFTLSTVGRTNEPQRLYGWGQAAVGVLGLVFQPIAQLVSGKSPHAFFIVLGTVSALAFVLAALLFPTFPKATSGGAVASSVNAAASTRTRIPRKIWFGVTALSLMATVQSGVFAYTAQIAGTPVSAHGVDLGGHGFSSGQIAGLLSAVGAVNIVFALFAAFLRHKVPVMWVFIIGPLFQALLAVGVMLGHPSWLFVLPTLLFVSSVVFTQTFVFGFMVRLDRSGRIVGGIPAMTMIGGAIGPVVAGALLGAGHIQHWSAVAIAAVIAGVIACVLMIFFGRGGAPAIAAQPATKIDSAA